MDSEEFDNLVDEQLADHQQMLESGDTKSQQTKTWHPLPDFARKRLERNKHCLDMLVALKRTGVAPGDSATLPKGNPSPQRISERNVGRFQILDELGSGGFGIVYRAWDPRVDRVVALKIPRLEMLASKESQFRFEQEARAVAKLDHPQIVSVLEAGVVGLLPYIATIYYPSVTLAVWHREHPQPIAPRLAAELVQKLADGLAHAHEHGVLHRDIKPGNILLVPQSGRATSDFKLSEATPKIIDFGLAKLADDARDMTQTGTLMGTVRYMSPEVVAGRMKDVGPASDVYSLGTVLYELLAGQPPFTGNSDLEILRLIEAHEPTVIRRVRPDVPRDLEIICLKCLEKEPARRYPSARSFAEDLARYLSGLPILARRTTPWQRFVKWSRRNPALAALTSVIAAAAGVLMVVLVMSNLSISRALQDANQERTRASKNEQLAREREGVAREYAYCADLRLAQEAWDRSTPLEAEQLLKQHIPDQGERDLRGIEWHYLWNSMYRYSQVVATQPTAIWSFAYEPRHKLFATGDREGTVRLWSLEPPKLLREFNGDGPNDINALLFTPDGETLMTAGEDHVIRQWRMADGEMIHALKEHHGWVGALAVSQSGEDLLSGDGEGRVLLWDLDRGEFQRELYRHRGAVRWILIHPSKPWVVSGCDDGEIRIWDFRGNVATDEVPTGILESPTGASFRRNAVFDTGGIWLFAHSNRGILRWDFRPGPNFGKLTDRLDSPGGYSLSILGENDWLLEGGPDGNPDIFVRHLKEVEKIDRVLHGHSGAVRGLAGLADANTFLSGSEDGTVRKWQLNISDLNISDPSAQHVHVGKHTDALAWSPDGTTVVAGVHGGELLVFSDPLHPEPRSLGRHDATICGVAVDSAGRRVIALDEEKNVKWWSLDGHALPDAFQTRSLAEHFTLTAADRMLAYTNNKSLIVVDAKNGQEIWRFDHPRSVAAVESLGEVLFTSSQDGIVRSFDAATGKPLKQTPPQHGEVRALAFSSNRSRFVTISQDKTVRIFDARTLDEQVVFSHSANMRRAFFIDDDRRLLIYEENNVWIVNPATGQALLKLPNPYQEATATLNRAGSMLVAPNGDDLWFFKMRFD